MYQYVDHRISELDLGAQLLTWGARQWITAACNGRCVCGVIKGAFTSFHIQGAVEPFHLAMRTLYHNALTPLYFGSVEREWVTEHEAIILGAALTSLNGRDDDLKAVARSLVHADMAPVFARSLGLVASEWKKAGMSFDIAKQKPGGDTIYTSFDRVSDAVRRTHRESLLSRIKRPKQG